jgi:hypothetical protein
MSIALLLLTACAADRVVMTVSQPGCADYDFENPPDESLEVADDSTDLSVAHVGVVGSCDAVFEPDVSSDGDTIEVREYWIGDDPDSTCTVCWSPTVTLQDPPRGRYNFRWYVGDTPFDTLSVEVD